MSVITVEDRGKTVRFQVRLQPRASRDEIAGAHGGALKIRVQAPPVDGAANDALIALLAVRFAVPRRDVRIVSGTTSRTKRVEIHGVTRSQVERVANEGSEGRTG